MSTDDGVAAANVTQLRNRVAELEEMLDLAITEINALEEQVDELQSVDDGLEEVTERVDEIDDRTNLLKIAEESDTLDGPERSRVLLQHLKEKAENQTSEGRVAVASINKKEAETALRYPPIDRTTYFSDMRRAAQLVGDGDLCYYDDGVLTLDLEQGSLNGLGVSENGC